MTIRGVYRIRSNLPRFPLTFNTFIWLTKADDDVTDAVTSRSMTWRTTVKYLVPPVPRVGAQYMPRPQVPVQRCLFCSQGVWQLHILQIKKLKRESCGSKGSEQPPTSWGTSLKSCGHHLLVPRHTPRVAVAVPFWVVQAGGVVADEHSLDAARLLVVLGPRLFAARLGDVWAREPPPQ